MRKILILILFWIAIMSKFVLAQDGIEIILDHQNIKKEEEVEISIKLNYKSISSCTLQIYFDITKLEYLNKTENANLTQNRIIYTWVDENAGKVQRTSDVISNFSFKALQNGTANIVVTGDFYDFNGKKLEIEDSSIQIQIGELEAQESSENENNNQDEEQISNDNTNLKIMRIGREGISPEFRKDIKEYYLIADNSVKELNITAIPENAQATVKITGNKNLKQGLNTINIQVQSKDKTKTSDYKIYVTKTNDQESANANLENLAIRQAMLFPSFDNNITQYEIEVANDIEKLDILAVPEKINAKIQIIGNDGLKVGDNYIEVIVTAENGITNKKYEIKVYKRNEQEEIKTEEEQKQQTEKLSTILANVQEDEQVTEVNEIEENKNENKLSYIIIMAIIIILTLSVLAIIFFIKNKKKASK